MIKALGMGWLLPLLLAAAVGAGDTCPYVRIERLSDRVVLGYWLGSGRCNLVAIRGTKGLAIVDTEMSPRIVAPIKAKIEQTLGRDDWAYVIDTHAHMHHAGGNAAFPGVTVVGHENLPADMEWLVRKQLDPEAKQRDLDNAAQTIQSLRSALSQVAGRRAYVERIQGEINFWQRYIQDVREGFEIIKPSLTFADTHTLDLGDVQLELVFFGKGHSISDTLVYVPQERLLVTGAIAYQRGQLPEVGERTQREDINRFLAVLERFMAPQVEIKHVISSHSRPLLKSDLTAVRDYYRKMLTGVQGAIDAGLTLEQTTQRLTVQKAFRQFQDPPPGHWAHGMQERNVRNLWYILHGLTPPPAPSLEQH